MSPSISEKGKPHIFLLADPQREKNHVRNYTKNAEAIAEYEDIVDLMYETVERKEVSENSLSVLLERFSSRFKVVSEEAGKRLIQLSNYFPNVQQLLPQLMNDPRQQIRLRLVQAIWTDTPPQQITDEIIRKALRDKSASVREFAAARIGQHRLSHLRDDFTLMLQDEKNGKVLAQGHFTLQQLNYLKD